MTKVLRQAISILTAVIMVIPIIYVIGHAIGVDASIWIKLWQRRVPTLLVSSTMLVVVVTLGTLLLGSLLAYLVERTDLPFRKILKPLLVAPLITPCYIIAICYVNFFGVKGLGEKAFASYGLTFELPNIYGFWGAAGVLIIGTYPYVYTIVAASLSSLDSRYSEAARCLGLNRFKRFFYVSLPLLVPAFSAGAILVALYVLSDFGVVSLLRYPTFVSTIYEQISGRYNYSTAASLSTVLIGMTLILFLFQETLTKRKQYTSVQRKARPLPLVNLKLLKWPAFILCVAVLFFGVILPVGILTYWFKQSFVASQTATVWGSSMSELMQSGLNSISISALAATFAVFLALPLAYWSVRKPDSLLGKILLWMSQSGIALPGVLIALGLSLVFSKIAPRWNFSVLALFLAFLVHFFAQSLQMTRSGLTQVSERLEEGARILGYSSLKTFWYVTRPLITPAILTAWILVFLSSMRELPASLLLRPAGFDPLTVKVWNAASEGFYEQAAAPALLIILFSLPLVVIITMNQNKYQSAIESN